MFQFLRKCSERRLRNESGILYKFGWLQGSQKAMKGKNFLVAGGGFEPPTFGL
jgi:hypothetical protein